MPSRRIAILDAVVAALNGITVAAGYATDLGVTGGAHKVDAFRNLRAETPCAVVSCGGEDKDDGAVHSSMQCRMRVEIWAAPDMPVIDEEQNWVEDLCDDLISDVEKALLAARELDPPLGVAGVQQVILRGHEKLPPVQEDALLIGALISLEVEYRHDLDDPSTYGGQP